MITTKVAAKDLEVGMFFDLAGGMCRITEIAGFNAFGQFVIRFETQDETQIPNLEQTIIMSADRLVDTLKDGPDPSWTPGRWVQVTSADGSLWCETSDEEEAREMVRPGDSIKRQFLSPQYSEWRDI